MESDHAAAQALRTSRLLTLSGLLIVLTVAWSTPAGQIAEDTKNDLYVDPWGLMARALHLWDPQVTWGMLQNQGYGYLFPMGPFYAVLSEIFPVWIVERLWWSALLTGGYLATLALLRALGYGRSGAVHVGALAYALAPRVLSTLGAISPEAQTQLLAPLILLPLVRATRGRLGDAAGRGAVRRRDPAVRRGQCDRDRARRRARWMLADHPAPLVALATDVVVAARRPRRHGLVARPLGAARPILATLSGLDRERGSRGQTDRAARCPQGHLALARAPPGAGRAVVARRVGPLGLSQRGHRLECARGPLARGPGDADPRTPLCARDLAARPGTARPAAVGHTGRPVGRRPA